VQANLLGLFSIERGDKSAGPWSRPNARRLCQLVLVSPGRRIGREVACEALFPNLPPTRARRALSTALSLARAALSNLGGPGGDLLHADSALIWANPAIPLRVDVELQEEKLRSALEAEPGRERDDHLALALVDDGAFLEGELGDWAVRPRERLDWARQEARLALARDRTRGLGRSQPEKVVEAWENCLSSDPTCEEAASALMRVYGGQGRPGLVGTTYTRCRAALEGLGLRVSPALQEVYEAATSAAPFRSVPAEAAAAPGPGWLREENRLVSVLFGEISGGLGFPQLDPEDLRDEVREALAELISEVELLGGTVTSVSGAGLATILGAPMAHEDDPERAVRAGLRLVSSFRRRRALSLRVGIETGPAVVGPIGIGARADYGAVGEVVGAAATLQSIARPGSVLVGPATRAATEGIFEWGPTEEVSASPGSKPFVASYVDRPKPRPMAQAGRRRLAGSAPLVGRQAELFVLRQALRDVTSGQGGVVILSSEPGLGKTRLVHECRALFMAWVGAASGRLPLWLEGRAASYGSSRPYGAYQQLLSSWVGVAPEEGEEVAWPALERAMKAAFAANVAEEQVGLLAHVMGLGFGKATGALSRLSPEQVQRASFAVLSALVSRLVSYGPVVLVLEDLHWADPTSLRLTEELSSLAEGAPLLVVLTRRPEPDPGVSALEAALGAAPGLSLRRLELVSLPESAERELALALLGEGATEEVLDAVREGAEGNPLFLEERLSSLLETRALLKTGPGGWRLDLACPPALPEALERLVRSRVDRLDRDPHDAIVAASVLGPEFALGALRTVTDLGGELVGAVSELCSSGLLVELRNGSEAAYRFRHALIQEATYRGLLRGQRRRLHARAAWGLEAAAAGRPEEVAALLGHHYAMAGEAERAAHYLELAGDHAAAAFAKDEAVASYRYGLDVLAREDVDGFGPLRRAMVKATMALRVKLVEVLLQTSRHAEARDELGKALTVLGESDRFQAARLLALLGRVEIADHRYDGAMTAFDKADGLLGDNIRDQEQEVVDLWLELQLDGRAQVHYWRNEPDKGATVLAAARPVVEARGTAQKRQNFYSTVAYQRARQTRYRIDDDILTNLRAALAAAREGNHQRDLGFAFFGLGFALLWHGDLAEAEELLERSRAIAEREGDLVLQTRALCYLSVTALRRHDLEAVRSLSAKAMSAGEAASYPEYVAAAKATQAWVAWRDERLEDVVRLAGEALALWRTTVVSYSWYWLCLWPLIAVRLAGGQVGEAVEAARRLLLAPQQRLPDDLESAVQLALEAWENGDARLSGERLREAVALAERLHYS
jgi:DNA-binding SARP family transcriptional activator/tetratricopeptide (TPR) repeat protein